MVEFVVARNPDLTSTLPFLGAALDLHTDDDAAAIIAADLFTFTGPEG